MRLLPRHIIVVLGLLWLAGPAAAGDDPLNAQSLPADARLVSDPAALRALLADHTVHGIYLPDGSTWREFSAADGRTIWEFHECRHPGTWHVSGSAVCYVYPSWDQGLPQCFVLYQSAGAVHFVGLGLLSGARNLVSNATLTPGNVVQLPLDSPVTCSKPSV